MIKKIRVIFGLLIVLQAGAVMAVDPSPFEEYNLAIPGVYETPSITGLQSFQAGKVAETIDPYSGRLSRVYTDLVLPGNGPSIVVTRTYHSLNNAGTNAKYRNDMEGVSILGSGWDINFGRIIVKSEAATLDTATCIDQNSSAGSDNSSLPVLQMPTGEKEVMNNQGQSRIKIIRVRIYD